MTESVVRAGGGIVWRRSEGGAVEIVLIHRPAYDDWSFPKGKLDPDSQTAVPVLPAWIIEPLWDQFAALLPERVDRHPLGCHNPRIADRVVFDTLLQVLVFGCAYQRIADQTCSARTLRRRRDEWVAAGVADALHRLALAAYDWMLRVGPWTVGIDWGNAGRHGVGRRVLVRRKPGVQFPHRHHA